MKNIISLHTPLTLHAIENLKCGDFVEITGTIYTARDAAHKAMVDLIRQDLPIPFDLKGQVIYYAGPCPAKPGQIIGSIGPTTSGRMDAYAPFLIERGLSGMIGKGSRNQHVVDAMVKHKCVYFGATGGAGALLAQCVKSAEVIAFEDLGTEAVRKLYVERFPILVVIDSRGNSMYK